MYAKNHENRGHSMCHPLPGFSLDGLLKQDMCLWNTDAPGGNKVKLWQKSKSYIFIPPHHQGHVVSVKSEIPLGGLTVQVWLLYDHPNLKYCTLLISGTELRTEGRTNGQTNRRTDDPNTRCPRWTFKAGGIKNCCWGAFPLTHKKKTNCQSKN